MRDWSSRNAQITRLEFRTSLNSDFPAFALCCFANTAFCQKCWGMEKRRRLTWSWGSRGRRGQWWGGRRGWPGRVSLSPASPTRGTIVPGWKVTIVQKTISDDDIILDHDDDIPADDEPTGRVHRTHGFCEEVDSRSVKVLALIFSQTKLQSWVDRTHIELHLEEVRKLNFQTKDKEEYKIQNTMSGLSMLSPPCQGPWSENTNFVWKLLQAILLEWPEATFTRN